MRKKIPETILFARQQKKNKTFSVSLWHILHHNKTIILKIFGLYSLSAMITYLVFVFMPDYATHVVNITLSNANLISTISLTIVTLSVPLAGWLSDYIGRKPCLYIALYWIFAIKRAFI